VLVLESASEEENVTHEELVQVDGLVFGGGAEYEPGHFVTGYAVHVFEWVAVYVPPLVDALVKLLELGDGFQQRLASFQNFLLDIRVVAL